MNALGQSTPVPSGPPQSAQPGQHRTIAQIVKDIALFFAAPFITLAYLALFPFIGLMTLRQTWRDWKQTG